MMTLTAPFQLSWFHDPLQTPAGGKFVPYGDDLAKVQLVVVHLGDEDGGHGLVERGAVHVDGGSHGQHEPRDPPVHVVVLQQALERDRQGGWAVQQAQKHTPG